MPSDTPTHASPAGPAFDLVTADRPLRAVVVGAGFIGGQWAPELLAHPDTELVGWVDVAEDLARDAAAELGLDGLPVSSSLTAVLDGEEPDFIVNCTVPRAHHDVTVTALKRGVSVLSEKPMSVTLEEARSMVGAADEARRLFAVNQNRRFMPTLVAFRRTVAELGPLGLLTSEFYMPYRGRPFLDELEHPLLQDMAIHLFDAARALSGADPVSVYCESFRPAWTWYPGACSATAIFEMTGGLRYTFTGSWSAPGGATSWTGSWRAAGSHGTARWDGNGEPTAEAVQGHVVRPPAPHADPFPGRSRFAGLAEGLEEFVTGLRSGRAPQGECHDNIRSLAMVTAALESVRTGTRVPILA
ncbi:Gfo/Idh/MocA family protein [Nonomuraea jiangxiensis]|uniref:Predicted dehydrogenase n=1 Tax=Nonomuraea jiangxiensis TaxID=633440 RepID=A0A1G9AYN0_9ACTN|nr:Gfo/Idh/MocA family oxidoreductase [Nonomuraea jiangxiensis]SDK32333.1 Predicted dehydrogenase [Nonomuraea jiangxiensis]